MRKKHFENEKFTECFGAARAYFKSSEIAVRTAKNSRAYRPIQSCEVSAVDGSLFIMATPRLVRSLARLLVEITKDESFLR